MKLGTVNDKFAYMHVQTPRRWNENMLTQYGGKVLKRQCHEKEIF
jgi:hypothetical protein